MSPTTAPPSPPPQSTLAQTTMPTLGSIVGSALGAAVAGFFKIADPVNAASVVTVITAVVTGLFHFIGGRIGQPDLG